MKIGIIGTAGRNDASRLVSSDNYLKMKNKLDDIISEMNKTSETVTLISGGAAFSDHLAISHYIKNPDTQSLWLALPCEFDLQYKRFALNHYGNIANGLHYQFSEKCFEGKTTSLEQIAQAIELGANLLPIPDGGFFARNTLIAHHSDIIVAFTSNLLLTEAIDFKQQQVIKPHPISDRGTRDTWDKAVGKHRIAVSISKLIEPKPQQQNFLDF